MAPKELRQLLLDVQDVVESFVPLTLGSNREEYQTVFGRDLDPNPYIDVISSPRETST